MSTNHTVCHPDHGLSPYSQTYLAWLCVANVFKMSRRILSGFFCHYNTADVAVTKIAGCVRVRILMNRCFFSRIFGIHSFYATATLLNI